MTRVDHSTSPSTEVDDPKVEAFLAELEAVCRKHGMCLGHEDQHGQFLVYRELSEVNLQWLREAQIAPPEPY